MSLKKTTRKGHGTMNELNITPLLDLVFVLLVIFIITTPQMMNNLEMALPSDKPPPQNPDQPKPEINRIVIAAGGEILLNDQVYAVPALKERLRGLRSANPELSIVVKASDEVDYQVMVNVLDTLQQLEITKVGLATEGVSP